MSVGEHELVTHLQAESKRHACEGGVVEYCQRAHRVRLKGHALEISAELSAKIVQVLFFKHTHTHKRTNGKRTVYKVAIYMVK